MIGRKATYANSEVTIIGYVRWGDPLKIKRVWFTYDSTGEEHTEGLIDIKDVTIHKETYASKRKKPKIH